VSTVALSPIENESSAGDLNLLKEATAHIDVWIDHLCAQTDYVLRAHGFTPGASSDIG
jgi:hypothetical protein